MRDTITGWLILPDAADPDSVVCWTARTSDGLQAAGHIGLSADTGPVQPLLEASSTDARKPAHVLTLGRASRKSIWHLSRHKPAISPRDASGFLHQRATNRQSYTVGVRLTAAIHQEGTGYVARCLELDVVSQGDTIEEAKANLVEAIELLFEDPADWRHVDPAPAIMPIEVRIPGDLQATA